MQVLRYAAFSTSPDGGNPAGVVLNAFGLDDEAMQRIAADVGYSETAFLFPNTDQDGRVIRYFSPKAEVPFCGHATIATAVALAEREGVGTVRLNTAAGTVPVTTEKLWSGEIVATLTSVKPRTLPVADDDVDEILAALGWMRSDLDRVLPPRLAYAGAWHPIIPVGSRARLASLDYDFDWLGQLMAVRNWTTVNLVWRESATVFHARNPFPPGGVREDPATGAAAAAFGGYLRQIGAVSTPTDLLIRQGVDMGRPGELRVHIPAEHDAGISVSGTAVPIPV